jgi:predicted TPR repeat methyltransferase
MIESEQPAATVATSEAAISPAAAETAPPLSRRERLGQAMHTHQSGNLEEAERSYRSLLAEFPDDADALHLLGVVRFQNDAGEEGLDFVKRSLERDPVNAHAWNNLGNMHMHLQQGQEAEQAYRRATTLDGAAAPAWYNLALIHLRRSQPEEALACLRAATRAKRDFTNALQALGQTYYRLGRPQESCDVYRQWAEEDPDNPIPRHLLAANSGDQVPERADENYIVKTFDEFADHFDQKLEQLGYCGAQLVAANLVHHRFYQRGCAAVLDAGCGTGWCGPLMKSTAGRLVGVDLSKNMLERARARRVYDELHEGELTAFMASRPDSFDIIVASDVLIYFGKLAQALNAARAALRPGGLLCFSVEALVTPEPGEDYRLEPHGRYAHELEYIKRELTGAGFPETHIYSAVVRYELGRPVYAYVAWARLAES